jgi:transposase
LNQSRLDPRRLVFLDETGLSTDMARRYGRALRGERLVAPVPAGHWQTVTLVQAIDIHGTRTAMLLDGPMDGASFTGFCEWLLAKALRPGEIVIMDNLSSHKSKTARAAITAAGADVLDLPSYSPDLNPIENVFSKLKALFRSAAARTWQELCEIAGDLLGQITASDCCNCFKACGYPTSPSLATLLLETL